MAKTQKKSVKRTAGTDGKPLPTRKELALVHVLSDRWKVEPPAGYRDQLPKTRAFIDLLVLSKDQRFVDVLRRLTAARQMVYDGWSARELAEKFFLSKLGGEILYDIGLQRAEKKWPRRVLAGAGDHFADRDGYLEDGPRVLDHLDSIGVQYREGDLTFVQSLIEACSALSGE